MMGDVLDQRREWTDNRIKEVLLHLGDASRLATKKACVYAIGSFGRGEASKFSDLDLFIVGGGKKKERSLSKLDEICIKANLIEATRTLKIQETFSRT